MRLNPSVMRRLKNNRYPMKYRLVRAIGRDVREALWHELVRRAALELETSVLHPLAQALANKHDRRWP